MVNGILTKLHINVMPKTYNSLSLKDVNKYTPPMPNSIKAGKPNIAGT